MSSPVTPELLLEQTNQILEETAFLCTELPMTPPVFPAEVLQARMSFSGPSSGEFVVTGSRAVGEALAESLLALEPGSPEAAQNAEAAFAEFLNILGGAAVAAWFGEDATCRLGLPAVARVGRPPPRPASHVGVTVVIDGGHRLDVEVVPA